MSDWRVIQSPTDPDMFAVQGEYLVADKLPIEDARLIASAPKMLRTFRSFLGLMDVKAIETSRYRYVRTHFEAVRAVIAEATGGAA